MSPSSKTCLMVGTHKGVFIFTSGPDRKKWELTGPLLKGQDVNHVMLDTRTTPKMYACVNSSWWGPKVQMSTDFGKTWEEPEQGVRFEEGAELSVEKVWQITAGPDARPELLYAGAAPGLLFRTQDAGKTWQEVEALRTHASRDKWGPGAAGMMVHSICPHPRNGDTLDVGISAAGMFHTEDDGKSWEPRNKGVLADFMPEKYPEVGQCVHHMERHAAKPDVLYQQNHCGVYRSDNNGVEWIDISEGLPSRFGFPLQIHPHDPDTVYVIPEEGPEFRCAVDGDFAVYRSRNRGETWERCKNGFPEKAWVKTYRQAMTAEEGDPAALYFGTSTGQVFWSVDDGDSWQILADMLPPVYSVECARI